SMLRSLLSTSSDDAQVAHFVFFTDTVPTDIYTLSLHDALPIWTESGDDGRCGAARRLRRLPVTRALLPRPERRGAFRGRALPAAHGRRRAADDRRRAAGVRARAR